MKKRFCALSLALFVLFCSVLCVPFPSVRADGVIDDLVYYALTVSGYMGVQYNSGGGSHSFGHGITATTPTVGGDTSKTMLENLRDAFQYAYDNHNISVDASGNYTFDSTITNNFYNIIQGSGIGGYNAMYFGQTVGFDDFTSVSTVNPQYINNVNTVKNAYSNALYTSFSAYESGEYFYSFTAYDLTDVAFISQESRNIFFYDSSGAIKNVPYMQAGFSAYYNSISSGQSAVLSGGSDRIVRTWGYSSTANPSTSSIGTFYFSWTSSYDYPALSSPLTGKVGRNTGNAYGSASLYFYSPDPVIYSATSSDGYNAYLYTLNPSSIVVNNYNVLPSVPGQTVQDTNFRETYAQYVNNVNNTYNTDNQSWNPEIFRTIAKDQSNLIINAINQGVGDITGAIESLEDKVQRILNVLNEIRGILANGGSSGGSGGGLSDSQYQAIIGKLDSIINGQFSSADLDPVLSELSSIDTGVGLNRDQLLLINNKLVQIYNALVTGDNSPNNPQSDNYTYGDNYYINNETDINNDLDILGDNLEVDTRFLEMPDLLRDVVPFCFVLAAGTLINKLAADPEPPVFEIPFSIPAFGIDETIVIDFSDFEELHTILTAGFSILFVVGCMYLEFKLLDHIYRMMS